MKHSLAAKLITDEIKRYDRQVGTINEDLDRDLPTEYRINSLEKERSKLLESINQLSYSLHILKSK